MSDLERQLENLAALPQAWCAHFLRALYQGSTVTDALASVGVTKSAAYQLRQQHPAFARAWQLAWEAGASIRTRPPSWIAQVIEHVRQGAGTGVAARLAGVAPSTAEQRAMRDPAFRASLAQARAEARERAGAAGQPTLRRIRPPLPPAAAESFWAFVDQSAGPAGCWIWQGRVERDWGRFWHGGLYYQAGRAAYELTYGPIPPDQSVLTECGNKRCVNPEHLVLDRPAPAYRSGPDHPEAKLSAEQVLALRQAYAETNTPLVRLAAQYSITESTALRIVRGEGYTEVGGPIGERPPTMKASGYWDAFATVERELRAALRARDMAGSMPTSRELIAWGRADLLHAIGRHGGLLAVAKRLGLQQRRVRKPANYWANSATLERELRAFVRERRGTEGLMPSLKELKAAGREDIVNAIRRHGGQATVAARLGLRIKKPGPAKTPGAANHTGAAAQPRNAPDPAPAPSQTRSSRGTSSARPEASAGRTASAPPAGEATMTLAIDQPEDQVLKCRRCGESFLFTVEQQALYKQHGWTQLPERCPACELRAKYVTRERTRQRR